jgi:hypothetical protein
MDFRTYYRERLKYIDFVKFCCLLLILRDNIDDVPKQYIFVEGQDADVSRLSLAFKRLQFGIS